MKKVESQALGISVGESNWERVLKVATVNREERAALSVAEMELAIGSSIGNSIGSSQATTGALPEMRQPKYRQA